jgi:ABC-2 type transport system permease protein
MSAETLSQPPSSPTADAASFVAVPAQPRHGRLVLAVFKRELRYYLHTPGTYVALAFFLLLSGALFRLVVADYAEVSASVQAGKALGSDEVPLNVTDRIVTQLFSALNFLVLFLTPMLTMRLVAEERRSGTFELLVTTPLGNWEILLGKYAAALTVGLVMLALTGIYPAIVATFAQPEWAVVAACYIGLFLILAAYTAFGVLASTVVESQIAAAVLAFVGLLIFQMVGGKEGLLKSGTLGMVAAALSIRQHSENFTKGIVASVDVVYFVFFSFFSLFVAAQVLNQRRWRA